MRVCRRLAIFLLVTMACGYQARGAEGDLKGLRAIQLVAYADRDSQACGIKQEAMRDAFLSRTSSTKLRVSERNTDDPVFFIQVLSIRTNAECASAINMKLTTLQPVKLPFADQARGYAVILWDNDGRILASPEGQHSQSVRQAIGNEVARFMIRWISDNRP